MQTNPAHSPLSEERAHVTDEHLRALGLCASSRAAGTHHDGLLEARFPEGRIGGRDLLTLFTRIQNPQPACVFVVLDVSGHQGVPVSVSLPLIPILSVVGLCHGLRELPCPGHGPTRHSGWTKGTKAPLAAKASQHSARLQTVLAWLPSTCTLAVEWGQYFLRIFSDIFS